LFDKGTGFDVVKNVWIDQRYWDIHLEEAP
jgi:hypothetical protein